MVESKISEIDVRLNELNSEKKRLDARLSFLLEGDKMEIAQSFRDEYEGQFLDLKDEERELSDRKRRLQLLQRQLDEAQDASKSEWLDHANKAISCIRKKDLISLKSTYKQLFQKIIVHPLERASGKEPPRAKRVDSTRLQLEFQLWR